MNVYSIFGNTEAIGTDNRWIRWNLAWNAFTKSPVFGHGLGSVFYEVGFYSHNIFTDMLCEGGVVLSFNIHLCFDEIYPGFPNIDN